MSFFSGLFGKRKRTLSDLALDDLNRERITLQQEQRKLDLESEKLDKDETQLKSEYGEASSPTQKKIIARKVQDIRTRRKAVETKASHCHKMLQTVNNFVLIKDNMQFFERMGVASMITSMDMAEIEQFISEATIEGTLQQDKLAAMLQQVSDGVEQITAGTGDMSLDNVMAELDAEMGEKPQTMSSRERERDTGLADVMGDLDQAIARGERLAREAQQASPKKVAEPKRKESGQEA